MPFISSIRGNYRQGNVERFPAEKYEITGGDKVYTLGGYKIHMFTKVGDAKLTVNYTKKYAEAMGLAQAGAGLSAEYLVIAAGGSGGNSSGTNGNGGGGAGGYRAGGPAPFSSTYVTVGGGNGPVPSGGNFTNTGGPSVLGPITSNGGGGGASTQGFVTGQPGGSGGGAGVYVGNGSGLPGQGNPGSGFSYYWTGGGGGGSGSAAPNQQGGPGTSSSITGSATPRAGGGGGGGNSSEPGGDGFDGGGRGHGSCPRWGYSFYTFYIEPGCQGWGVPYGRDNTGGGGGAGSYWAPNISWFGGSGYGGPGVVIIKYPT